MRPIACAVLTAVLGSVATLGQASAEPGPPETLEALLAYAHTHAPSVRAAQAQVGLAEAEVVEAEALLPANPEVEVGLGRRAVGGEAGLDLEISVAQQVEIAGERGLRAEAAQAERRAALAAVAEARWLAHVEVHRLFVELLLGAERRAQAERFVALSQALQSIAAKQVEAGESSPLTVLVADADLAQTREALIELGRRERATQSELAAAIGWPGEALTVRGVLPPVRRAPAVDSLLEQMATRHPSLQTRALAVAARRARRELAEREAWPAPTFGLAYTREAAPGPEPEAEIWSARVAVPLPLWRTNQGERRRAEAAVAVAEQDREAAARQMRGALARAAGALDAAFAIVELYETGVVPQLEQNLALLQKAYRFGEVDIHQVSQTRQRLLDATRRHFEARTTYYEAAATLEGLSGVELWTAPGLRP